jgi:hypothetical protein
VRSLHNNGHVAVGHPNFCNELLEELHQAKLFDKLLPARTQGDARAQDLLSLLQQTNLEETRACSCCRETAGVDPTFLLGIHSCTC